MSNTKTYWILMKGERWCQVQHANGMLSTRGAGGDKLVAPYGEDGLDYVSSGAGVRYMMWRSQLPRDLVEFQLPGISGPPVLVSPDQVW